MHLRFWYNLLIWLTLSGTLMTRPTLAADLNTYHSYEQMTARLESMAKAHSEVMTLTSLIESDALRQAQDTTRVWLVRISGGDADQLPAIFILGGVEGSDLVGSELCLHFIDTLLRGYGTNDSLTQLLDTTTFYIIPRVNPQASEAYFQSPQVERHINREPHDLDRDGATNEDGPDDLNGDGLITLMRITDPTGEWLPDPDVPHLLRKADPTKGESGIYRLLSEGVDNDGDGQWNEDAVGGVNFNQNFTYHYQFFKPGAGAYQMSAAESRAVAEFAFSHANVDSRKGGLVRGTFRN